MTNRDVYAKVFAEVVEAMKQGRTPWVRPWRGAGLPYNALSKREYSGGNIIALSFKAMMNEWPHLGFVTFKQALAAGCVVRKGEKGTPVYFMSSLRRKGKGDEAQDGERIGDTVWLAKLYTVFNVAQLDELESGALAKLMPEETPQTDIERCVAADMMVSATGAMIAHNPVDQRAYYSPSNDCINMPPQRAFTSTAAYYGTLFHELTHWTGAERRLNRTMSTRYGKPEYAFEELVAEFGSCFLSAMYGFEQVSQAAAYLSSWVKGCTEHPDLLASAAAAAQRAVNYVTKVDETAPAGLTEVEA